ncbi:MAG: transporter ATP-binding protein [Acidimicrobiales bacterium]|nr:transporter ATP-binding protein [Acidimicrobiales bacterium]
MSAPDAPIVRMRGLRTWFPIRSGFLGSLVGAASGWIRAVDGVDLDVEPGETFGVVGESGSGKTTLGRSILRLVEPTDGVLEIDGRDITHVGEGELRPLRRQMQLVFQDPNAALNPAMTIADAVAHPLKIHGMSTSRADGRRQAAEMLERVGISPASAFLDRYPEDLSGGQKQRVVIARALITRPQLVVADEPVAMLDMSVRAKILELMLDLQRELGLTYVFITHDLATARFLCDRIAIMYMGKVVEIGPSAEIFAEPRHPYTRALLQAIPRPDPSRRGREKNLPKGEVPDAGAPPRGCRFHPRCPSHFAPCGWEGRDLVEYLEERWTDPARFEAESAIVGPIDAVVTSPTEAVFPRGGAALAEWLEALRSEPADPLFEAVEGIDVRGPRVVVRFGDGPEPALQDVGGCRVACHLYGLAETGAS